MSIFILAVIISADAALFALNLIDYEDAIQLAIFGVLASILALLHEIRTER